MSGAAMQEPGSGEGSFVWHPEYAGKSFASVRRRLADEIQRDQRAYHLALENAAREEHDAFTAVRELEKRWCVYDFGWFDLPPDVLAARIVAFERAREDRHSLISWEEWRATSPSQKEQAVSDEKRDWRENMTDQQRKRLASALSIGVIVLMILVCFGLYALIR